MFLLSLYSFRHHRLDRLNEAAKELSAATGRSVLPAQADVREPTQIQGAVAKAIEKFGRIDFVICGMNRLTFNDTDNNCFCYAI